MEEKTIHTFPTRRLKPIDGLTITADVWEEAHDYHRRHQQLHNMLSHGAGILTGLEVIASDPPDTTIYVKPGIAMDHLGNVIILKEAVAYNLHSTTRGVLYLLLSYVESAPRDTRGPVGEGTGRLYIHSEYALEAQISLEEESGITLARIRRDSPEAPIHDASNPEKPGINELDLRFRQETTTTQQIIASVAVCYLGDKDNAHHSRGVTALTHTLRRERFESNASLCVWHDEMTIGDSKSASLNLTNYDLVYVVAQDGFKLNAEELEGFYTYLQDKGTLFIENCHQASEKEIAASQSSLEDMLTSLGVQLTPLADLQAQPDKEDALNIQRLLSEPYLFATPPAGYETQGSPQLLIGEGVILSTYDYGCLWQGMQRAQPPTRSAIRSAHEWGSNLIHYARSRKVR